MAYLYRILEEWEFNNLRNWNRFRNLIFAAMIDFGKHLAIASSLLLFVSYKGAVWGLRLFNNLLRLIFIREEHAWHREHEEFIRKNALNRFFKI